MAPITPEIGALGYDFDDINGVRAVDLIEMRDLQHQVNNTSRHDDLIDTIRRLEAENRDLRDQKAEDIKEAEESVQYCSSVSTSGII